MYRGRIVANYQFKGKLALFAAMDNVRFKNIVRPGDRLDMEIELVKLKGPIGKSHAVGYVDGKVVVEADRLDDEHRHRRRFEKRHDDLEVDAEISRAVQLIP